MFLDLLLFIRYNAWKIKYRSEMESPKRTSKRKREIQGSIAIFLFLLLFIPLCIFLLIYFFIQSTYKIYLKKRVHNEWYPKNKYLLFVYSDGPNWKEYIESNILPRISDVTIFLNWTERKKWLGKSRDLEVQIFKTWSGLSVYNKTGKLFWQGREYNPIAIIFPPKDKVRILKFWKAFRDHKHGKTMALHKLEHELFETLDNIRSAGHSPMQ